MYFPLNYLMFTSNYLGWNQFLHFLQHTCINPHSYSRLLPFRQETYLAFSIKWGSFYENISRDNLELVAYKTCEFLTIPVLKYLKDYLSI
jgi:hypothetical protein